MRARPRLVRLALVLMAIALIPAVADAVIVAPHAVFIDHRSRTGELILQNTGTEPEEVMIDLQYGFPTADTAGRVYIALIEQPHDSMRSAAGWIRAFPRQVRLAPQQRQVVRLLATPPATLPDGEYWSRVLVTARGGTVPVAGGDSLVQAGLTLVTRTILSVSYRKNVDRTAVRVDDVRAEVRGDTLVVWTSLARDGAASYLGTAQIDLRDANGRSVVSQRTSVAVYHPYRRRFDLPLAGVPAGAYTLRFELSTARDDLPADRILPGNAVERTVGVTVP